MKELLGGFVPSPGGKVTWMAGPFVSGQRVRKKSGSQWQGRVVGCYSSSITPCGYCVESEVHRGSVQIYPAAALEAVPE